MSDDTLDFAQLFAAFQPTKQDLEVEAHWAKDDARWAESVTYNDGGAWSVLVHPGDRHPFALKPDAARQFAEDLLAAADETEAKEGGTR